MWLQGSGGRVSLAVLTLMFRKVSRTVRTEHQENMKLGRLGLRIFPEFRTLRGMTEVGLMHPIRRNEVWATKMYALVNGYILSDHGVDRKRKRNGKAR